MRTSAASRTADDVDMVGPVTGAQPHAHRCTAADSPPRRHLPQIGARLGKTPQPPEDRCGDELFIGGLRRDEIAGTTVQQSCVEATRDDVGVGQQETNELDVGDNAEHRGVRQSPIQGSQRRSPIRVRNAMTLASMGS